MIEYAARNRTNRIFSPALVQVQASSSSPVYRDMAAKKKRKKDERQRWIFFFRLILSHNQINLMHPIASSIQQNITFKLEYENQFWVDWQKDFWVLSIKFQTKRHIQWANTCDVPYSCTSFESNDMKNFADGKQLSTSLLNNCGYQCCATQTELIPSTEGISHKMLCWRLYMHQTASPQIKMEFEIMKLSLVDVDLLEHFHNFPANDEQMGKEHGGSAFEGLYCTHKRMHIETRATRKNKVFSVHWTLCVCLKGGLNAPIIIKPNWINRRKVC